MLTVLLLASFSLVLCATMPKFNGSEYRPLQTHLQLSTSGDSCPATPIVSCSPEAPESDSCCVVSPGGLLVHEQFWDLEFGVADSFGIHGLFPDTCNGKFLNSCDKSRSYSGNEIAQALQDAGQDALVKYMETYWVSDTESPTSFWAHEWDKHGTCISTLNPECIDSYQTAQEVVPYFFTIVSLFQQLDTYKALTKSGIEPSKTKTYTLEELQKAVEVALEIEADFTCKKSRLASVQYRLNARGPLQRGDFVASQRDGKSECPKSGIQWPPKSV